MTIKERIEMYIEHQGIKRSVFEKSCGFSNGYLRNLKENPSAAKIEDILTVYPEISRVWLLSGEGEMLKPSVQQTSNGAYSPNVNGDGNNVNAYADFDRFLKELAAQRRIVERTIDLLEKRDEQIDRLISIFETQK